MKIHVHCAAELIEAPFEEVLAFLAAWFRFCVADAKVQFGLDIQYGILDRKAAEIETPFGWCDHDSEGNLIYEGEGGHGAHGTIRISKVRSNPSFVMIEGVNQTAPVEALDLASFGGFRSLRMESRTLTYKSDDGTTKAVDSETLFQLSDFRDNPQPSSVWQSPKYTRRIFAAKWSDQKDQFQQSGEPLWFEDASYYRRRRIADRLNSDIVFSYLEKLGIDPVAVFKKRELDDPVLFTLSPNGDVLPTVSNGYYRKVVRHRVGKEELSFNFPGEFYPLAGKNSFSGSGLI